MRRNHLVVAHEELEVELLRQLEAFRIRWCQKLAHPSFMIFVSICGMKYCASSWTIVRRSRSQSVEEGGCGRG